jgi:hypothetical protein
MLLFRLLFPWQVVLSDGEYTALVLIEGWLLIIAILLDTHRLKTAVGEPR